MSYVGNVWVIISFGLAIIIIILLWNSNYKRGSNIKKLINISAQYIRATNIIKSMLFVPESIVTLNDLGEIVYSNNKTKNTFGWSEEELRGERMSLLIPTKHLMDFELFKKDHSEDDETHLEIEGQKKNNGLFPIEVRIGKWYDDELKQIVYYTVILKDISHRRDNELVLKIAREQIDKLNRLSVKGMEILRAGSWSWDMITDNVEYDEGFRKLYRFRAGEIIKARDVMDMVHAEDLDKSNNILKVAIENKIPYTMEYRIGHKNNTRDLVKVSGVPELNKNGNVIRINGAVILIKENVP